MRIFALLAALALLCASEARFLFSSKSANDFERDLARTSREKSGSNGGSATSDGQDNGSNGSDGADDWKDVLAQCGLDEAAMIALMTNSNPVSPAELKGVISDFSTKVDSLVPLFDVHSTTIQDLTTNIAAPVSDQIASHTSLVTDFTQTLMSVYKEGTCAYIKMTAVADRIRNTGVTDEFPDNVCNELYKLMKFNKPNADTISLEELHQVGAALRNDVGCIIDDINDYKTHVSTLASDSAPTPSYRSLQLAVASIEAYGVIVEHEVHEFWGALDATGKLIEKIDMTRFQAPATTQSSNGKLLELLKKLRRFQ